MKVKKMIKLLENEEQTARIFLNERENEACGLIQVEDRREDNKVILSSLEDVTGKPNIFRPSCIVCVSTFLMCLRKLPENADIILNSGNPVLFSVSNINNPEHIVLEDKTVNDLYSELEARFKTAAEEQIDELDFFIELLEDGFTLADIKEYIPEKFEYSKIFMQDHGLLPNEEPDIKRKTGICKYCKSVSDPPHPEGLHTWTGYVCENPNSEHFCNSRSTIMSLCDDCEERQ